MMNMNIQFHMPQLELYKKILVQVVLKKVVLSFFVSTNELNDIIEISSIGYESIEITVQDFINTQDKKFTLKEKITELPMKFQLKVQEILSKNNFLKKLKDNSISEKHKLGLLYRRWSVEDNICRYFIEQYIDVFRLGAIIIYPCF